jgi:thioredoxin
MTAIAAAETICPSCGARNRLDPSRPAAEAVCGSCQAPLAVEAHPVAVSDAEFESTVMASKRPVLVDFWAPWCGPCRMVAPFLEAIAGEMAGRVTVAKVNTDESSDWANRLGVRGIPTMILFKDGQELDRQVGALPKDALKRWLESKT